MQILSISFPECCPSITNCHMCHTMLVGSANYISITAAFGKGKEIFRCTNSNCSQTVTLY